MSLMDIAPEKAFGHDMIAGALTPDLVAEGAAERCARDTHVAAATAAALEW